MKKIILSLMLFFALTNCTEERNCSEFKTGRFVYADKNMPDIITRTESQQIEINPETKVEIHTNIEWVSDCEYLMTYEKILNYDGDVSGAIGRKIYVEILETDGKKVKVRAKSDIMDENVELIKIE